MDFWKDLWPTLIAPFIILVFSPLATAIGKKISAKNKDLKNIFDVCIALFLVFIFTKLVFLGTKYLSGKWDFLTQLISGIFPSSLNIPRWIYCGIFVIFFIISGIAYMSAKGGWSVETLQAKIDELVKSANLKN